MAEERGRGINGGDPFHGEETVYAAKARSGAIDGGPGGDRLFAFGGRLPCAFNRRDVASSEPDNRPFFGPRRGEKMRSRKWGAGTPAADVGTPINRTRSISSKVGCLRSPPTSILSCAIPQAAALRCLQLFEKVASPLRVSRRLKYGALVLRQDLQPVTQIGGVIVPDVGGDPKVSA